MECFGTDDPHASITRHSQLECRLVTVEDHLVPTTLLPIPVGHGPCQALLFLQWGRFILCLKYRNVRIRVAAIDMPIIFTYLSEVAVKLMDSAEAGGH